MLVSARTEGSHEDQALAPRPGMEPWLDASLRNAFEDHGGARTELSGLISGFNFNFDGKNSYVS